ncbi:MAG: oxaloacetate decarboxylase [SAR324 cluster bacterium]|nr:oxaloacetate decarboxylase [SAR324 cluster bacterium]
MNDSLKATSLSTASLCTALKRRLERKDALLVPGVPNALLARMVEDAGFEAVYVTGAGVANAYLGVPDIGLTTLTELAEHVTAIREAVSLPLIVDADTGFGNPLNVIRTVRLLEQRGANGIQIEDQVFPKRCGHFEGKEVIPAEEMVQKVRAAADARRDADFVIIARTDARAVDGFEEAIERAQRYREAGADVTFVEAPQGMEELRDIPRRLACPQVVNMVIGGKTPLAPLPELREMGYAMVLYANAALQGAIQGAGDVLRHLRAEGSIEGVMEKIATFAERQRLVAKPVYDALEKKYASPK